MAGETARHYRRLLASPAGPGRGTLPERTVRIGFVGAGGIAHRHLGVLEQFEDVSVVGFADPEVTRAQEAAGRYGGRAFADYRSMLEAEELDAVYICVPPFAHGRAEEDIIARGLPFFVEKPLSVEIGIAERIATASGDRALTTAVGYHWRCLDIVAEARRLLAENPAQLITGYWLDSTPPPQWWWKTELSGGQVVEQATHILDLARYLVGDVTDVFGCESHLDRAQFSGLDVATASTTSLKFASGAVGSLSSTCLLNWKHRVGLHLFSDGLAIELTDQDIVIDRGQGRTSRAAEGDPVWQEDRDFVDAVQGKGNSIACSYQDALESHRLALAVASSAASGRPVRVAAPTA